MKYNKFYLITPMEASNIYLTRWIAWIYYNQSPNSNALGLGLFQLLLDLRDLQAPSCCFIQIIRNLQNKNIFTILEAFPKFTVPQYRSYITENIQGCHRGGQLKQSTEGTGEQDKGFHPSLTLSATASSYEPEKRDKNSKSSCQRISFH